MAYEFISPSLETELLSYCVRDASFLEEIIVKIKLNDFGSDITKSLYYEIIEHYKKFGAIPGKAELLQKINDKFKDKEIGAQFVEKIYTLQTSSSLSSLIATLKEKKKARSTSELIHKLANLVNEGKIDQIDSITGKFLENSYDSTLFSELSFSKNTDLLLQKVFIERENPTQFNGCPTGFLGIDQYIKAIKEEELMLVIAGTGVGKSTFMLNVAANAFLMGKRVLFFVIESAPEQYSYNMQSYISGIEAKKLQESRATDEELLRVKKTMEKASKNGGEVIFIDAPQDLTPTNLQMKIREAKRKYGIIDLVVVDYMQIAEDENGKGVDPYDWKRLTNISKQYKSIARAERVPLLTAAQKVKQDNKNQSKKTPEAHNVSNIAYGKGIADNCDIVLELDMTEQDKLMNTIRMYLLKSRRTGTNETPIKVICNYALQTIDTTSTAKIKAETIYKVD